MKALLIGSSFTAIPILQVLKDLRIEVVVMGADQNDPCHALGDSSVFQDYSHDGSVGNLLAQTKFDFLIPTCNDSSYNSAVQSANLHNLPGYDNKETIEILHNKIGFRDFCNREGLSSPRTIAKILNGKFPADLSDSATLPSIVKPTDAFSGRGVTRVNLGERFASAVEEACKNSLEGSAVIEEFVPGTLHSISVFVQGGSIIWHDFVDEFCKENEFQVNASIYPSELATELKNRVYEEIARIVAVLKLADGLLHVQFKAFESQFWLIETMRRCPGDLFPEHFKLSTGFDYWKYYVYPFLGRELPLPESSPLTNKVVRNVLTQRITREVNRIQMPNNGAKEQYIYPLKKSGEILYPAPHDKAGVIFSVFGRTKAPTESGTFHLD